MRKGIRTALFIILAGAFFVCGICVLVMKGRYRESREVYQQAASAYTDAADASLPAEREKDAASSVSVVSAAAEKDTASADKAPIRVNFDELTRTNPDIWGWIYCEDTPINYPVLFGRDNSYYLDRNYRQEYDPSGSIFSDGANNKGVVDSNIILYGHHMLDGSMFATLRNWFDLDYYEAHPIMWLLTPEQDYRVDLFAGYTTTADSWTYTIFLGPGPQLDSYLQVAKNSSAFTSDVTLDSDAKYIVLSTCAYNYDNYDEYRTVLHGKLVPVE